MYSLTNIISKRYVSYMILLEVVTLPKRSEFMVTVQVEGNFDEGAVAVVDPMYIWEF